MGFILLFLDLFAMHPRELSVAGLFEKRLTIYIK